MKASVMNVEKVMFKDGNFAYKVQAVTESGIFGQFYTSVECQPKDNFDLSISVDNNCKFVVRKTKIE